MRNSLLGTQGLTSVLVADPISSTTNWPARLMLDSHATELRVRYDECDPMGFVHHSIYLQYFEIARTELYRASGGNYRDFESSGLFVVVVKVECNYKQPAKYDDLLSVRVTIDRMTEAKIVQSYVVSRTSPQSGDSFGDSSIGAASAPEQLNPDPERPTDIIVTAKVTLAVVDRTGKAQRIPDTLRNPGSAESR